MTSGQRQYSMGDPAQGVNQSAEFFLSNYRLGKTLGIGSFGKVRGTSRCRQSSPAVETCNLDLQGVSLPLQLDDLLDLQVKVAEHVTTGHKVAIKILNKKKIKHMDMEEKGMLYQKHKLYIVMGNMIQYVKQSALPLIHCSATRDQDPEAVHASAHNPPL